jgi:hypothetical protein
MLGHLCFFKREEAFFAKQTQNASCIIFKISKCFPGLWKRDNREEAKEEIILLPSPLLSFVTTMKGIINENSVISY